MTGSDFLEAILGFDEKSLADRIGAPDVKRILGGRELFDGKPAYKNVMGKSVGEQAFGRIPLDSAAAYQAAIRNFTF